jgi:hypothetical protein
MYAASIQDGVPPPKYIDFISFFSNREAHKSISTFMALIKSDVRLSMFE